MARSSCNMSSSSSSFEWGMFNYLATQVSSRMMCDIHVCMLGLTWHSYSHSYPQSNVISADAVGRARQKKLTHAVFVHLL
jgi:hypothetical protein